jgi:hypothetical protein
MRNCKECKYSDVDYVWDEELEDEYQIYICDKGNDTELDGDCGDFKKYKPKKYVEHFTKCDKCKDFEKCKPHLIEITMRQDTTRHYINGIGEYCQSLSNKKR